MSRRAPPIEVLPFARKRAGHEPFEDDGCPLCIAAREGKPIDFDALYEPAYLIAEARRVLGRVKLAPGEETSIVESGRLMPDQSFERVSYTVDATGCIYVTRNGARSVVTRIMID